MPQRPSRPLLASACALAAPAAPVAASAAAQQSDVVPPGGFVTSCAADTSGTNYLAYGADLAANWSSPAYNGRYACNAQMFNGAAGTGQASASHSAPRIDSSSAGSASMGWLQLAATNASPANTNEARGAANGGWSHTSSVTVDGLSGNAVWLINVGVSGSASGIDWLVAAPVPEPPTWALTLAGLAAVGGLARRRLT